jgi:hypothetical protein
VSILKKIIMNMAGDIPLKHNKIAAKSEDIWL